MPYDVDVDGETVYSVDMRSEAEAMKAKLFTARMDGMVDFRDVSIVDTSGLKGDEQFAEYYR